VLLPQVLGQAFANPQESLARLLAPWRANHMAKATVEMAFWDLWAKSLDLPLQTVLGGEGDAIEVGVSLGIGPIDGTLERVASAPGAGLQADQAEGQAGPRPRTSAPPSARSSPTRT
jgi:O-succinylbenzoate synthase